ncbi:MAG: PEP/pyruvate-binding domain-containing protein [Actinobacteria bacterium]|nr:PEP/pyruvate-binding domain-containing protein [Actinomycetota bacterium]
MKDTVHLLAQHQPILWLEDPAAASARRTGGKAAALAGLADRLPIPPGFVVVGEVDPAAVELAYAELGARAAGEDDEPLVAVRSSAVDEDSAAASFAGLHETYLNVVGAEAVIAAVERCWASALSERARAYRRQRGLAVDGVHLAVLVQLLVPADVAAVAFSANPLTSSRDEVVINVSWGLGESIVGGTVTPDEWALHRPSLAVARRTIADKRRMTVRAPGGSREVDVPAPLRRLPSITDIQARGAASLALELERDLGFPVDLELAWTGDDLHLLQCRPITTLAQEAA